MRIASSFAILVSAVFVAQSLAEEPAVEKSVRLLKVHFASNGVDVEWVMPIRDLAALPMWSRLSENRPWE